MRWARILQSKWLLALAVVGHLTTSSYGDEIVNSGVPSAVFADPGAFVVQIVDTQGLLISGKCGSSFFTLQRNNQPNFSDSSAIILTAFAIQKQVMLFTLQDNTGAPQCGPDNRNLLDHVGVTN